MKKIFILFLTFIFLLPVFCIGAAGKSGWTIFRKVQSAKFKGIATVGMIRGDLSGVLYNPALLGTGTERELFFMSELGFAEDKFGGIIYGNPLKEGMLAGGVIYYDAGIMELNWIENDELKSKTVTAQKDLLAIVSYGRSFARKIYLGSSIKFASSEVAEIKSAMAYCADIGALYTVNNKLSISLAAQNLGSSTEYINKDNPLPMSLYLGSGYFIDLGKSYILPGLGAIYNITDETLIPLVGFEAGYELVSINCGYRINSKGEANLHLGLGINLKSMDFGYAFIPGTDLNTIHQLSMGYRFGNVRERNLSEQKTTLSPPEKKKEPVWEQPLSEEQKNILKKEYFTTGNDCLKIGDYPGAIEAFRKVLEIDPEHTLSRQKLKKAEEFKK